MIGFSVNSLNRNTLEIIYNRLHSTTKETGTYIKNIGIKRNK